MKKGLRLGSREVLQSEENSNSRPDEEGIKTTPGSRSSSDGWIPTADLMKKGLRLGRDVDDAVLDHSNSRPDEEGIKTGSGGLPHLGHSFQQQT